MSDTKNCQNCYSKNCTTDHGYCEKHVSYEQLRINKMRRSKDKFIKDMIMCNMDNEAVNTIAEFLSRYIPDDESKGITTNERIRRKETGTYRPIPGT